MNAQTLANDHAAILAPYTFDALLEGAARMRPNLLALGDAGETHTLTFTQLAQRVSRLAAQLGAIGLRPGEAVVVLAAPEISSVIAIFAAARLGLNVALAPLDISAPALALCIQRTRASAALAPGAFGDATPIQLAFDAAPLAPSLRLIGAISGPVPDGAVDLTQLGVEDTTPAPVRPAGVAPSIITFERHDRAFTPIRHHVSTLVAAALAFIMRAQLGLATPILSTIAPASFAGLVSGPLAMLLSGATLRYNGPFDSAVLRQQMALAEPAFLIAPAAIGQSLAAAIAPPAAPALGALLLVSRWRFDGEDYAAPTEVIGDCSIFDLSAFGERTMFAEPRNAMGQPGALLAAPQIIDIGGERIVALNATHREGDRFAFSGAAVSSLEPLA